MVRDRCRALSGTRYLPHHELFSLVPRAWERDTSEALPTRQLWSLDAVGSTREPRNQTKSGPCIC